ncbi:hypothetical protein [Cellulophaga baltica]|uniref:hypothetical protein n=1 Tax=Cellulophaga baltica TaxID=76594 RepID=UPI002495A2EF|nr:hypothetical protein [Cellulophaga baltica]
MAKDLIRAITHENYGKAESGLQKYYHKVEKVIYHTPREFTKESIEKGGVFNFASDEFMTQPDTSNGLPFIVGGVSLSSLLALFFLLKEELGTPGTVYVCIAVTALIFSIIYYFTKPPKESILNRRDGLVTMEGALYQPNITMRFKNVIFCFSTGGENGLGAYKLEAIRPNNYTFAMFHASGKDCYYDMSFFTWYMDKNRPLPPGSAFDPFRQKDFERRKAEGFPRPLYMSNVPTPEATLEQQKERERFWKEEFVEKDGVLMRHFTSSGIDK